MNNGAWSLTEMERAPVRELKIDWAALYSAFQLAMPDVRCYLSLADGSVLKLMPGDPQAAAVQAAAAEFVAIDAIPSRIQYQWVDEFTKTVEDEALRARMEMAINGKGAFRRFKDILLTTPDERRRWFEYRDQKMRQRIVDWVREKGVEPANEPPWMGGTIDAPPGDTSNHPHDIEALRDFLIDWAHGKGAEALQPLALDSLTGEISKRFVVKSR